MDDLVIKASFDGVVEGANVEPGERISSGASAFVLSTRDQIVVALTVTEAEIFELEELQVGVASFDAIDGVQYPIRITTISRVPNVEQGVVTYSVEATVLSPLAIQAVRDDLQALGVTVPERQAAAGQRGAQGEAQGVGQGGGATNPQQAARFQAWLQSLDLPEGVSVIQVVQAIANDEPLPGGVELPEDFEITDEQRAQLRALIARFSGGGGAAGGRAAVDDDRQLPVDGMSASVTILTAVRDEAVLVSTSAVRQIDGAFYVAIPTGDGGWERLPVQIGETDGTNVEILSGLEEGATVLVGADSEGIAYSATQLPGGGTGRRRRRWTTGWRRRWRGRPRMIRLEGVRKTFAAGETKIHALDGVDLEIERGEFVAIMGQSGSGKSTMMNIIGLLDRPDEGAYLLSGTNVATLSEHARARLRGKAFGFVFQSYSLLPRMSALEQVELPLIYQGVRDRRRRAAEALVRVGLADRIWHRPTQLSGGEQQRVAIARSLVVDPLVVLADEPTGALDTATGHEVMTLLSDLVDQHRMTIVLVTHEQEVAAFAHRTIRMRDGKVIDDTGVLKTSHAGERETST